MQAEYTDARALLRDLKSKPCMDCGGSFPSRAMHFDHRDPSTKKHNVSKFASIGAIDGMLSEIEKCDLVCANCHATRTEQQWRAGIHIRRLDAGPARKALSVAMSAPGSRLPGVSTRQAAIILGTSESDVRRRIRRGELQAEQIPRSGGTLLRVLLDAPEGGPTPSTVSEPGPRQDAPDIALVLLAKLDERDATLTEQANQIAALSERVGRAEADAGRLQAELDRERRPWWRKLLES